MGRIHQSGGLKAPDKAEEGEGEDEEEEEGLQDVTEFRAESCTCRAGLTPAGPSLPSSSPSSHRLHLTCEGKFCEGCLRLELQEMLRLLGRIRLLTSKAEDKNEFSKTFLLSLVSVSVCTFPLFLPFYLEKTLTFSNLLS